MHIFGGRDAGFVADADSLMLPHVDAVPHRLHARRFSFAPNAVDTRIPALQPVARWLVIQFFTFIFGRLPRPSGSGLGDARSFRMLVCSYEPKISRFSLA